MESGLPLAAGGGQADEALRRILPAHAFEGRQRPGRRRRPRCPQTKVDCDEPGLRTARRSTTCGCVSSELAAGFGRKRLSRSRGRTSSRLPDLCAASGYALSPAREAVFCLLSSKSSIELQHIIDTVRRRRHVGRRADTRVRTPPHRVAGIQAASGRTLPPRKGIHRRARHARPTPATRWGPSTSRTRPHPTASSGGRLCAASADPKSP
jgi:hypothetical protein